MTKVLVLIPVLNRPERAATIAANIRAAEAAAEPLFLASPGDDAEIKAATQVGWTIVVDWEPGPADYGRKMNYGYEVGRETGFEWIFLGADDLNFYGGWFDACLLENDRHNACVIGTNDLGNRRTQVGYHSTHTLVHRDYLDCGGVVDDPTRILCEEYDHQFVDDEFVQTAIARVTYRHAPNAWVEHLHPSWGKAQQDATYRKAMANFDADRRLYESRKSMWIPRVSPDVMLAGSRRRG